MKATSKVFARLALMASGIVLVGGAANAHLREAWSLDGEAATPSIERGIVVTTPAVEARRERRSPRERGQVLVRNRAWDSVRVEMRAGPSEECDENALVAVRTLKRGRRWKVFTDDNLCWRREMNPNNPTTEWTPWVKRRAGAGQSIAELLQ